MKNIKRNPALILLPYLLAAFSLSSCKKESPVKEEKKADIQYLKATIDGQSISLQKTDNDRTVFYGSWTGLGMGNGAKIDIYTVDVNLPKASLSSTDVFRLSFQIYDVKKRKYEMEGDLSDRTDFGAYIYAVKKPDLGENVLYSTSSLKKPFHIEITKYEYPKNSLIPIVGGKFNGVLYNTKNLLDSIVVKNGEFEVRY
ncbi:DUF5025 domain-containing protein [Pedobacter gandavensis]|uniref:DUF5025 domain-containing protein n=1 Tax=Pedobacter gandavensis TaxID=2679963 RepID=UPI00292ECACA|nr:DUF5025 domain-containing protein [Pedobacter gandavensis]